MTDPFDSIRKGLEEAIAYAEGRREGARVHRIEIPEPDVRAIRAKTGLSQHEFTLRIGVKKATLVNWEQGRRRPQGPAHVLLALIAHDPDIVHRTLGRRTD